MTLYYWNVLAQNANGRWVKWAGVVAATKSEAQQKAATPSFKTRVRLGSEAQHRKYARWRAN